MTSDIRYVSLNGARLGYQVHSEGSGRPPVVFVHGYSGRSTGEEGYSALLNALAEEFTIYALDARGHGASASEIERWSMTAAADDLPAFVEAVDIKGALYIGHSFGGFLGMDCEVRHPGTFAALCLLNTASAEGGRHTPAETAQLLIEHGRDEELLTQVYGSRSHARAAAMMDRRVHETYFAEYPDRIIIDQIGRIRVPVLILSGARDTVVPLFTQHATALALPNCKEVILSAAGHMMPLEAPAYVAREIVGFWTRDIGTTLPCLLAEA